MEMNNRNARYRMQRLFVEYHVLPAMQNMDWYGLKINPNRSRVSFFCQILTQLRSRSV